MKKILLIPAVLCLFSVAVKSQITITLANYSPPGAVIQYVDTVPLGSITPGSAGANQTYDFSTLVNDLTVVGVFGTPATGILGSSFPMTNFRLREDTMDLYIDQTSTYYNFWGAAGNLLGNVPAVNRALVYSNPQTMITFPSTYNTAFTDTANYDVKYAYNALYNGYYVDSLREKERIISVSTIDGWGTVRTPTSGAIAFDCLRQNIVKNSVDTVWAKVVVGNFHYWLRISAETTSTPSFSFVSPYTGPIVDFNYYTGTNTVYRITWNTIVNTATPVSMIENNFNIYPNPNAGEFDMTFDAAHNNNYTIEVRNVLGQIVYTETLNNFSGKYSKHFNLSSYGEGIYMVNLFDNSGLVKSTKISITQ